VNFNGVVRSNDLLLTGFCRECGNKVARLIENEPANPSVTGEDKVVDIALSRHEQNLLLKIDTIEEGLVAKFRLGIFRDDVMTVRLNRDDLDSLLGHIAAAANHATNRQFERDLEHLYDKLHDIEKGLDI
jgi:hypothetical protein